MNGTIPRLIRGRMTRGGHCGSGAVLPWPPVRILEILPPYTVTQVTQVPKVQVKIPESLHTPILGRMNQI